jgi:hypothetical protein
MRTANVSRNASLCLSVTLLSFLCLLSACAGGFTSPVSTAPGSTSKPTSPTSTQPTLSLPDEGVAATIPVNPKPDIFVEGGSAEQLTFVGTDTKNISTNLYALPYKKKGNRVDISFGQPLGQALEIQIPRESNLTVTLTEGNVTVTTLQGPVDIHLTNGTIHLKDFTPSGTNTIQTESGTIDVTFAKDASCSLKAQTSFGTIVSGYAAISGKRNGEADEASGSIRNGSKTTVTLTVGSGSITLGPVH